MRQLENRFSILLLLEMFNVLQKIITKLTGNCTEIGILFYQLFLEDTHIVWICHTLVSSILTILSSQSLASSLAHIKIHHSDSRLQISYNIITIDVQTRCAGSKCTNPAKDIDGHFRMGLSNTRFIFVLVLESGRFSMSAVVFVKNLQQ